MKRLIQLLLIFAVTTHLQAQFRINEFMAINTQTIADTDDDFDDWIEIVNTGAQAFDLAGYYLSDDAGNLTKWQAPHGYPEMTTVPGRGHLLIWADNQPQQGLLHAAFKLAGESEQLFLTAPNGTSIVDSVRFQRQYRDLSFARFPDGADNWGFCPQPTPGAFNFPVFTNVARTPVIQKASGIYGQSFSVTILAANPADEIYYTLNGTDPDETATHYTQPVSIDQTAVLRARAYRAGWAPGEVVSESYFINPGHHLPILSIVTDPGNLFDDSTGIYARWEQEGRLWERPVKAVFLPQNGTGFEIPAGLRIQGNTSRKMDKKSFRFFFREDYGQGALEYPLFQNSTVTHFENLVLRAGYDDDLTTSLGTLLRDPFVSELWRRLGHSGSHSRYCMLYINNDLWGIYDIRESVNETFFRDHTDIENLDIIRYRHRAWEVDAGDSTDWHNLLDLVYEQDFYEDEKFRQLADQLNLDAFNDIQTLYNVMQYRSWTYGCFMYRNSQPVSKWDWVIWDMDRAMSDRQWDGFYYIEKPQDLYYLCIITQKLLQNAAYRWQYINRHCDLMNSFYLPENTFPILDSLTAIIRPDMLSEVLRWNADPDRWETNVERLHIFIEDRLDYIWQQLQEFFELKAPVEITLTVAKGEGKVKINSIIPKSFPWTGRYFAEIPVAITAIPADGFRFAGWTDQNLPQTPTLKIGPMDGDNYQAIFEPLQEHNIELLTPSRMPQNGVLPLVVRIHKPDWQIDKLATMELNVSTESSSPDTSFIIKKGAGSIVQPVSASGDFSLTLQNQETSANRTISVSTEYPTLFYSGILTGTNLIWDGTWDRIVTADLTVPKGEKWIIKPGTWILLENEVNVFVYGQVEVRGTAENPVVFISRTPAEPWGGIEFYGSDSKFEYCFFVNGCGDDSKGWAHTGRQSLLYPKENSTLVLDNCFFLDSRGKALGGDASKLYVSNSITSFMHHGGEFNHCLLKYSDNYLMNIPNDDHIFVDGDNDGLYISWNHPETGEISTLENCVIITTKDDAVDEYSAKLKIINCWFEDTMHEGLAASGQDTVWVQNCVVKNCDQGLEAGWTAEDAPGPNIVADHCVIVDNGTGLRIGDSYDWTYRGHITATNLILYNNEDNILNYLNSTQAPLPGAIDISWSMTNDAEYDTCQQCFAGTPQFDAAYFLLPGSPGVDRGTNGTDLGLMKNYSSVKSSILINEIMYNPAIAWDTDDWVEFYNPKTTAQDLSGWALKDSDNAHSFVFPQGMTIPAQGFLIVCRNAYSFLKLHPALINVIGNFEFGLGRGDVVRLFDAGNGLIDSVAYDIEAPWPTGADGRGYSLALKDVLAENDLSQNWFCSYETGGTPGALNGHIESIENKGKTRPKVFRLVQNYPNPFNACTQIMFTLPKEGVVSLAVYNTLGQQVVELLKNIKQAAGFHQIQFDAANFSSGIYFYQIRVLFAGGEQIVNSKKLVILK